MIRTELYFNGQLADFDNEDEDVIAGTYATNQLGEIESRQGNHTNTYNLPMSNRNRKIFENAENPNSVDDTPYRQMEHVVIIEGVEVFRGFARIEESGEVYEVTGYSGNTDFYTAIKDKDLRDIDVSDLDHIRDDATVAASWTNTEGYIYAFLDYGKYVDLGLNGDNAEIMPDDLYPHVFMKTLIERIVSQAGYQLKGSVLKDQRFRNQLVPFGSFPLVGDQDNFFNGEKDLPTVATTTPQVITLQPVDDPGGNYDAFGNYVSPIKQRIRITLTCNLRATRNIPFVGTATLQINKISGMTESELRHVSFYQNPATTGFANYNATFEVNLNEGDKIFLKLHKNETSLTASVDTMQLQIDPIRTLGYGAHIEMSKTLPDESQADFFLDFLNQYGLIQQTDTENKILTLTFFDDIPKNNPVDWSNKIDDSERPNVKYRFDNYAQNNTLKFKNDEVPDDGDVTGIITDGQAKVFTIDDTTLEKEYTAFESNFYLPTNDTTFQGQLSTIAPLIFNIKKSDRSADQIKWKGIWNGTDSFVKNDVVYDDAGYFKALQDTTNVNPSSDDGTRWEGVDESDIWDIKEKSFYGTLVNGNFNLVVKFQSGDLPLTKIVRNDNLNWSYVWDNYYKSFSKILDRTKIVKVLIKLNYADINQLDLTRPVYISRYGNYFYVDIVDQFKFNETDSTYVTLVRL